MKTNNQGVTNGRKEESESKKTIKKSNEVISDAVGSHQDIMQVNEPKNSSLAQFGNIKIFDEVLTKEQIKSELDNIKISNEVLTKEQIESEFEKNYVDEPNLYLKNDPEELQVKPKLIKTSSERYYIWPCPKCQAETKKGEINNRICQNKNCDYGKPKKKLFSELPTVIKKTKHILPDLNIPIRGLILKLDSETKKYYIMEGQEELIIYESFRYLKTKTISQLTKNQLLFLYDNFPEQK